MGMKKYLFLTLVIVALTFSGCSLFGIGEYTPSPLPPDEENPGTDYNPTPQSGMLLGTVTDLEYPDLKITDATITINGQAIPVTNGTYVVPELPNGTYLARITKRWYRPMEIQIAITGTTIRDIQMTPELSWSELDLFARIVYSESKGESYQGQVAVAATVLNRVLDPSYPNTIAGVVNQVTIQNGIRYYQYEPVKNGTINQPANQTAKQAARNALAGWDPTRGATGFFAHAKVPQWSNGKQPWVWQKWNNDPFRIRIGNHSFFR